MHSTVIHYLPPAMLNLLPFIIGILARIQNNYLPWIIFIMLYAFIIKKETFFLTFLFFIGGFTRTLLFENSHLLSAHHTSKKYQIITGTIIEQTISNKHAHLLLIETERLYSDRHAYLQEKKKLRIKMTKPINCRLGDKIIIKNLLVHHPKPELQKSDVDGHAIFTKITEFHTMEQPPSFISKIEAKKHEIDQYFQTHLSPTVYALSSSIFLGKKIKSSEISRDLLYQFQNWGISHYLARSGIHLTINITIISIMCILLPLSHIFKKCIIFFYLLIYTILSWSSISFLRSLCMAFITIICAVFQMRTHGLHSLSITCWLFLLYNPSYLFHLDFQLSFLLTYALLLFNLTQKRNIIS